MRKFITEKWFILAVAVITVMLLANMILTVRNNLTIERTTELVQETEKVKFLTDGILTSTMHGLDLGVRGFGLTKDDAMLNPYHRAIELNPGLFRDLGALLKKQKYPDIAAMNAVEK